MLDLYENECVYNFYLLFNKDNPYWCEDMDVNYHFLIQSVAILNMRLEAVGYLTIEEIYRYLGCLGVYWDQKNWINCILDIKTPCFLDLQITKLEDSLLVNIRIYES